MSTVTVNVSKLFNRCPGGRFKHISNNSAEELRDDHLIPLFEAGHEVVVDFADCYGVCASFAEEAFGGLVRKLGPDIVAKIRFRGHPCLVADPMKFLDEAVVWARENPK